jgi:hypothetical protein
MHNQTKPIRRWLLPAVLLIALTAVFTTTATAQRQRGGPIYLPFVTNAPPAPTCDVPRATYTTIPIIPPASDPPAAAHPDVNLTIRGWRAATSALRLTDYGPTEDSRAPHLDTLFADRRLPRFTSAHHVYSWDWAAMTRIPPNEPWDTTLLGLSTTPNEIIYTPDSGYDIGGGNDAMVLCAAPTRLTLKYTREDNVVSGYTIHLENICVEPDLLTLYNQANAAGRGSLPVLRGGQPLGRAASAEILVAIRDTGMFLDPRSRHDWWPGH